MSTQRLIKLVIYVTAISFVICAVLSFTYNVYVVLKIVSTVVAVADSVVTLYISILWRYINIFGIPKVYGNYDVYIDYVDPNDNKRKTKHCFAEIKQDLISVSVYLKTDERRSETIACALEHKDNLFCLYYIYRTSTKAKFLKKNPEHLGATELYIEKNKLEGKYWTTNKSLGDIEFIRNKN